MPQFENLAEQIFEILNEIGYEHCVILFGNSVKFESWLKNHKVEDSVSNFLNPFK